MCQIADITEKLGSTIFRDMSKKSIHMLIKFF